jgi:tetratricopeptide (TPR) repeat protein
LYINKVHETLDASLKKSNERVAGLNAVIHHYGKLQVDREAEKEDYYLRLALEQAKGQNSDKWSHFNVLQQALGAKKNEIAIQAAENAIALGLRLPFIYWGLGVALQEMNRHDEAIGQFDIILKSDPRHIAAITKKAISIAVKGDLKAARSLFSEAIEINPEYLPTYCHLATLEAAMGLLGDARKTIADGLKKSPKEPQLFDALIKMGIAGHDYAQAAMDAWAAIGSCPAGGEGKWHLFLARFLAGGGEKQRAKAVIRQGMDAFPENEDLKKLDKEIT